MIFLLVALVWFLVAVHVVGGAALFHRVFPRESPWFGFIVPGLVLVVALSFIEREIAFPSLRWLGAVTFMVSAWAILSRKNRWRFLRLPTVIFLTVFTFALVLRCLKPDVASMRDGVLDLHLVSDFCMGNTLPPESTWLPGFKLEYYYVLPHYGASVLIRLLGFDIGTGFNAASALVAAWVYFLIAATAWRVGGHRVWIVILCVGLTATALDGITPYLWLTHSPHNDPDDAANLLNRADDAHDVFPLYGLIDRIGSWYSGHELIPPGYYSWKGGFHSVTSGQFLVLFGVYCLVEMVRRTQSNAAWVCSFGTVLLMIVSSTWGVPLVGAFFIGGLGWCASRKILPRDWRLVAALMGLLLFLLSPSLLDLLRGRYPGAQGVDHDGHTQVWEFILQWWPVYVPFYALLFWWKSGVSPAVRILQVILPAAFVWVEFTTIACRLDTTGKLWGYIFIAGWAVFLPAMAAMRSYATRGILLGFVAAGVCSACFWIDYDRATISDSDKWHLEGKGDFETDAVKGRILNELSGFNHQTLLTGKAVWSYNESGMLASFSRNTSYLAYSFHCNGFYPGNFDEPARREKEINDIYDGKNPTPVPYLRERGISAVVVWPEDNIPKDTLEKLKGQLAGAYWYRDCRNADAAPDAPTAGVFMSSPQDRLHPVLDLTQNR